MNKRDFLASTSLVGGLLATTAASAVGATTGGPGLLTVTGDIGRTNRGPLDPALDQMMVKHGVQFTKAFVFDAASLRRLPEVTIRPTIEYDAKVHTLSGPLLDAVLDAAGAPKGEGVQLELQAVDGYRAMLTRSQVRSIRMIVALAIDGRPLVLGDLGPQWAVFDAGRIAPYKDQSLQERFAQCPWGLYHVEVKAG